MSAEEAKPPPFYCPACGKKHRADLSALEDHAGAHAKVTCARCDVVMSIFLGDDGLPKCGVLEATAHLGSLQGSPQTATRFESQATAPAVATEKATVPSDGGTMSKSNLPLQLVAAALVAGVISFAFGSATKSSDAPDSDPQAHSREQRVVALEARIASLESRLAASAQVVEKGKAELRRVVSELQSSIASNAAGLNAQGKTLGGLEQVQTVTGESVKKVEAGYEGFHGRIESNYNTLRGIDRRLKTLEGK